ncbi:MAG: hypothetical protein ABW056_03605 [Thermoanaerobaculia bacterium]
MRKASASSCVGLLVVLLVDGCAKKGDPVRETIDAVVKAANARDAAALLTRVAPDFEAADGASRLDVEVRLKQYFAAYEIFNVTVSDVQIERGEGAALVRLRAQLSGQPRAVGGLSGLLPSDAKYDFEIRLMYDGEAWKITWAAWTPVAS